MALERARTRGRRRAAARVDAGRWRPHPRWRHCLPAGQVVLTDQAAVLRRIHELTGATGWRPDRRAAWTAILRALAHHMDWHTGLVTGATAAALGAAAGRGPRTVSSVIRWAKSAGLLATLEEGAAATFLGSATNRAPTYAFLTTRPPDQGPDQRPDQVGNHPRDRGRDELCDLPLSHVGSKPLTGGRRLETPPPRKSWPLWRVPETPSQRNAAVRTLSARIGLDHRGGAGWRARPLLMRWFEAGWCVAGLLHALDHHPDHPDQHRGDALRGARDPIRLLGHRLAPWTGRLDALPGHLHGLRGDYQTRQAHGLAHRLAPIPAIGEETSARARPASEAHRARLRAEFAGRRRTGRPAPTVVAGNR